MPPAIADLIAAWMPFVVLLGVLVFFMRSGGLRARGPSGHSMIELYELQLEALKRNNAALERIALVMEQRSQDRSK
jgi:hypothetical protein